MRNGMSVKEVYDALEQHDRLLSAYQQLTHEYIELIKTVREIYDRVEQTAKNYRTLARDRTNNYEDQCDFYNRNAGLLEALTIVEMSLNKNGINDVLSQKTKLD